MSLPTINLDDRDWASLVEEAKRRISAKCPSWTDFNPSDPGMTLVELMAWLTETVLYRLNRVPENNYIKLLDLIGVRLQRARPARTWVFFKVAETVDNDELLTALETVEKVRVSTRPLSNGQAVRFVTRQPLHLTALKIKKTCSRYPAGGITEIEEVHNLAGDHPWETDIFQRPPLDPARGTAVPHILYLGDPALREFGPESLLAVQVDVDNPKHGRFVLEWETWDGATWQPVPPSEDTTQGLQSSGQIRFDMLPELKPLATAELTSGRITPAAAPGAQPEPPRWLRARLVGASMDDVGQLKIRSLRCESGIRGLTEAPRCAFVETPAIDVSPPGRPRTVPPVALPLQPLEIDRQFYPFGTMPRVGSAFYFESPLLQRQDALIRVQFDLLSSLPAAAPNTIEIAWEYLSQDRSWLPLGVSRVDGVMSSEYELRDETQAFTKHGRGQVQFRCPRNIAATRLGGQFGWFIRARLQDLHLETPAELIAQSVALGFSQDERSFAIILTENYSQFEQHPGDGAFQPFQIDANRDPAFYIGCSGKPKPAGRVYRLFLDIVPQQVKPLQGQWREPSRSEAEGSGRWLSRPNEFIAYPEQPQFKWEYRTAEKWMPLQGNKDGTGGFAHEGIVEFLSPPDWTEAEEFKERAYWLRVRWEVAELLQPPRLRRVAFNGVEVEQMEVVERVLGSSNGSPDQSFSVHAAILEQPELWVRESGVASEAEAERLRKETGAKVVAEKDGCWVQWESVLNFYHSGSDQRHFKVDLETGTFHFGNGVRGKIPPPGRENVSAVYTITLGAEGNVGRGTITILDTGLAHVQSVTNIYPAEGGSDPEGIEHAKQRGPWELKHRDRAVTREDFIELAKKSSPLVGNADCSVENGVIHVIIVPNDPEERPRPNQRLIRDVTDYLEARRMINTRFDVRGPEYEPVDVEIELVLEPGSVGRFSELRPQIEERLRGFVHPITGLSGAGWPIGRALHISELYFHLEAFPGVDHVERLTLRRSGSAVAEERIVVRDYSFPCFSPAIKIIQVLD